MKENLLKGKLESRKSIDSLAKKLNLSCVGTRDQVVERIKSCSYKSIKNALYEGTQI